MVINYIEKLKSDPKYFKQFSCKELLFINYDCPIREDKVTIWSEHNYFYYVVSGRKNIHANGKVWELAKGSFAFVKRGVCLIEQFYLEPFCIVVFIVPDSFINKFMTLYKDQIPAAGSETSDDLVITVSNDEMLTNFCNSILGIFASNSIPSESIIELKFLELLLNLCGNASNKELISYFEEVSVRQSGNMEAIMESNFNYNLELEDFAKLCNRSLSSFKRDFKNSFGTTPGKWLLEKRLNHAGKLLINTSKPILDIILDCGFENQTHFNKVFREKFDMTPLQFRKKMVL